MTDRIGRKRALFKQKALAVLRLAAMSGPVSVGILNALLGLAQSQTAAPLLPAFDVASVKRSEPFGPGGAYRIGTTAAHGELSLMGSTLKNCIRWAYGVKDYQVIGPGSLDSERYDIVARADGPAPEEQLKLMLRSLLAERFTLALHRETRVLPGLALLIGKSGPKIREARDAGPPRYYPGRPGIHAERISMERFAAILSNKLEHPVLDTTGLKGVFRIDLDWTGDEPPADGLPGPSIFTAIQDQLGLKLARRDTDTEVLVIDHAEKVPTAN